jgi:hypothetical protein
MNKEMYLEILCYHLLPYARGLYGNDGILHQDNDAKHTSIVCRSFLEREDVLWVTIYVIIQIYHLLHITTIKNSFS